MDLEIQTVASLQTIMFLLDQALSLADDQNLTGVAARLSGVKDAVANDLRALGALSPD